MSITEQNLKDAFAGESQANRKYLAFAKKAEQDGFANVARLFRTAAEAETVHALGHFDALGGVGSTADNLRAAISGETYEFTEMYPPMVKQAQAEGHQGKHMLRFALDAEQVHARLFKEALAAMKAGQDLSTMDVYLCPVCGDIEFGAPPDKCPICGAPASKYVKV